MANLPVKDSAGSTKYLKESGAGTDGDPHVGHQNIDSIAAGENHIGEVGGKTDIIEITLSLDTSAYADGDVLADTQALSNAVRVNGGSGIVQSVTLLDKDAQAKALDLVFLQTNVSLGTENAAVSISDVNAEEILGIVEIAAVDYVDLGGSQVVNKNNLGVVVEAAGGSSDLYVGAISRGAGTYTASGIVLKIGILQD